MKFTHHLAKFGTVGLFLTALFSPCCFPLFAFAASALGMGTVSLFGGWAMYVFQFMVLVSVAGLFISYRKHQCFYPLMLAIPSASIIFYGYYINQSENWIYFLYVGMAGLFLATLWNHQRNKLHGNCSSCESESESITLNSTITCPHCKHQKAEIMPTNACTYFYECEKCKTNLKPLSGDCCVYCSYGSVKCPPIQAGNGCC